MVEETVARFGRLDLLVNSAGICILGPVVDFRVEDWDALMVINLRGTFLCCRAAVRQMLSQGGHAQIINVVSNEGFDAHPTVAAYDASKHALIGFTRALRQEVQPRGIRVSALCPMSVDTGMRREVFPNAADSRWLDPGGSPRRPSSWRPGRSSAGSGRWSSASTRNSGAKPSGRYTIQRMRRWMARPLILSIIHPSETRFVRNDIDGKLCWRNMIRCIRRRF